MEWEDIVSQIEQCLNDVRIWGVYDTILEGNKKYRK
jgi:hypothetical protein